MSNQSPLIQYTKKGPPYVTTGGRNYADFSHNPMTSDDFSTASDERCAIRGCANTFTTQPLKIFVPFPIQPSSRSKWLEVVGLDPENPPSHKLFCCEDHFDLKKDVMNLSTLRSINSGIVPNLLKDNVLPHRHINSDNPVATGSSESEEMKVFITSTSQKVEVDPLSPSNDACPPKIRVKSTQELLSSTTPLIPHDSTTSPEAQGRSTVIVPTSVIRKNPHSSIATPLITPQMRNGKAKTYPPAAKLKYRECAVPGCPHNLRTFPDIQLVCVPFQERLRREWYSAIGRQFTKKSTSENLYICTDHFLKEQLETAKPTFGKSGLLGPFNFHIRAKHDVLPTLKLLPVDGQSCSSRSNHAAQPQRVPDLTPHSPSVSITACVDTTPPSEVVSHRTSSQADKYAPISMPQYPDCQHNGGRYQCSALSVMDCSSFYSQFYSLDTRNHQNEFIFSHTKLVSFISSQFKQPVFQFFVDQKKSSGVNKCVPVCAQAFSSCLSFDITALMSLIISHFSAIKPVADSKPATVLKPIKSQGGDASEDDDIMIYEPVPVIHEIVDSSEEETSVPDKVEDRGQVVESAVDMPLTVEEELRQSDLGMSEGQGESENIDMNFNPGNEPYTFETVHICTRCLEQFKSKSAFDEHTSRITPCHHFIGDVFNCTTCGRALTSFENLKVHTTVFHKYVCPKCSDTFRYRRYLEDHVVKCSGTNQLSEEMSHLVDRTKAMQNKIADNRKRDLMESQSETSEMPTSGCSVILERLQLPSHGKQTFKLNQQTGSVDGTPQDLHCLKIRAAFTNSASSPISNEENNISSTSLEAGDFRRSAEPEEEVDVESTNLKGPPRSHKKRLKHKFSSSSSSCSDEQVKKYPRQRRDRSKTSGVKQNPTTTRELRSRRPVSLAEPDSESDIEQIPELATSGGDSELDPDFDPSQCKNRKRKRRRCRSDSESSSGSGTKKSTVIADKNTGGMNVKCGRCNAPFHEISGLLAHHRLPEKCGKFLFGTAFKCNTCRKTYISQTMLDEHLCWSSAKNNCKPRRTPTPVDVDLLNCVYCNKSFSSLYNLRFHLKSSKKCLASVRSVHEADDTSSLDETASGTSSVVSERRPHNLASGPHICKGCSVLFSSALGLGLHLKRSPKCIADNPDVDIPGVVDKSLVVDSSSGAANSADQGVKRPDQDVVYVCVKCHSAFSSVWGLRTHERNSTDCKPDRPYEIPVPIPKEQADKQKKEFLAKQQKENQQESSVPTSSKGTENGAEKRGFMMVYTQESLDEDGKFKCKTCSALFTSVWGLRTHHRISESCMDKNAPRFPRPYQKTKIILSDAAAESIAKGENICPNCSAKFSTSWGLRTHLRTSSLCSESETNFKALNSKRAKEAQLLTCSNCKMPFLNLKQLRDHVKCSPSCLPEDAIVTKNGRVQPGAGCFLCPRCPKTFNLPYSLEQHFIEHAPPKEDWPCHLCNKNFPDRFVMRRHFHREHLGKWFCILCENKSALNTFKEFYAHIFANHVEGTGNMKELLKCNTCCKSFFSKFSYDFHVYSCEKLARQVFRCASCLKIFNKKIHISNHMKYAHAGLAVDERYKFKCPNCPRRFLSEKEYLENHQNECCVEEEMPCEMCGEMYNGFEKLKMHLEMAHKKRSELHTRRSPQPDNQTVTSRTHWNCLEPKQSEPVGAEPVDMISTSISPVPSFSTAEIQESPTSPDSANFSSVKIEPSSP